MSAGWPATWRSTAASMRRQPRAESERAPMCWWPGRRSLMPRSRWPRRWSGCAKALLRGGETPNQTLVHLAPAQFNGPRAALAIFLFDHGDGTDVAPIVDFIAAVLGNFINANDLGQWRAAIAPDEQFHLHLPQALVAAKRPSASVFQ